MANRKEMNDDDYVWEDDLISNHEDEQSSLNIDDEEHTTYYTNQHCLHVVCHVFGRIPLTPDDVLRMEKRTKNGMLVEVFINDRWIRAGEIYIKNFAPNIDPKRKIQITCLKPHPYEVPMKIIIPLHYLTQPYITNYFTKKVCIE